MTSICMPMFLLWATLSIAILPAQTKHGHVKTRTRRSASISNNDVFTNALKSGVAANDPRYLYQAAILKLRGDPRTSQIKISADELMLKSSSLHYGAATYYLADQSLQGQQVGNALLLFERAGGEGAATAFARAASLLLTSDTLPHDAPKALLLLQRGVQSGDPRAMVMLGDLYRDGAAGVPANGPQAVEMLTRAADAGDAEGKSDLADLYLYGMFVQKDLRHAHQLLTESMEDGYWEASLHMGDLCVQDPENLCPGGKNQAVSLWRDLGKDGHPEGYLRLASLYSNNEQGSRSWLLMAAQLGEGRAMYKLAYLAYLRQIAVRRDPHGCELVRFWAAKSKEVGYTPATNLQGVLLAKGICTKQNLALAAAEFRLAAEKGDAAAMLNLGTAYAGGLGLTQSDTEAFQWWSKAAEPGMFFRHEAELRMALALRDGKGTKVDKGRAFHLIENSPAGYQGKANAGRRFTLGQFYRDGTGTAANAKLALEIWTALDNALPDGETKLAISHLYQTGGAGLAKDKKAAAKWLQAAASACNQTALAELKKKGDRSLNMVKGGLFAAMLGAQVAAGAQGAVLSQEQTQQNQDAMTKVLNMKNENGNSSNCKPSASPISSYATSPYGFYAWPGPL